MLPHQAHSGTGGVTTLAQPGVTTAGQDSWRGELSGVDSSGEEEKRVVLQSSSQRIEQLDSNPPTQILQSSSQRIEQLDSNSSTQIFQSSSQRLEQLNYHPPTHRSYEDCSTRSLNVNKGLNISRQYNQICTTHKKLVRSGQVTCSVSLSDTPPKVDLPAAPNSPTPAPFQLEGSVHWGAVGEFSGVQTPDQTPALNLPSVIGTVRKVSVIQSAPPALPPRTSVWRSPPPIQRHHRGPTPNSDRTGVIPRKRSSTDHQLLDSRKIPIVSTSVSSLESFSEVFQPAISPILDQEFEEVDQELPDFTQQLKFVANTDTDSDTDIMAEAWKEDANTLMRLRRRLVRRMEEFTVGDINTSRITVMERDLDRIAEMKDDYQDGVLDFIEKFGDIIEDVTVLDRWERDVHLIAQEVKTHADTIRTRAAQVTTTSRTSDNEARSLQIQEAALKLQELSLREQQQTNAGKVQDKADEDRILAETESNLVLGECSVLGDMMATEKDWEEVADEEVSNAMRNLNKWQDQMNNVERVFRKYENMAIKHNFPEVKKEAVQDTYHEYRSRFETARDAVKKEDVDRCLFTLEPARTDIIKYPTFSGLPSEDYLKFRETMEQRFRENKVKKKEQVAKLRECLKAAALGRVPDGVSDIVEAFRRLNEAFGNPNKVMGYNLKALEDLGTLPPEKLSSGHYNYNKQIEWYLKLEVILGKILDLSRRSSRLAHEAFASSTYRKLWARFPTSHIQKLVKVTGEDAERMEGILNKIIQMREQAQLLDDECGSTTATAKKKSETSKVTAEVFFRPAQYYQECRVCVHLSSTSSSQQGLFDNHLSNYATGCPKFMEASTDLRKTLVKKVKLCPQCFNPEVIFTPAHLKSCVFNKKKNKYSCMDESCKGSA